MPSMCFTVSGSVQGLHVGCLPPEKMPTIVIVNHSQ